MIYPRPMLGPDRIGIAMDARGMPQIELDAQTVDRQIVDDDVQVVVRHGAAAGEHVGHERHVGRRGDAGEHERDDRLVGVVGQAFSGVQAAG